MNKLKLSVILVIEIFKNILIFFERNLKIFTFKKYLFLLKMSIVTFFNLNTVH